MVQVIPNNKRIKSISIPENFNTLMTLWYEAEYQILYDTTKEEPNFPFVLMLTQPTEGVNGS